MKARIYIYIYIGFSSQSWSTCPASGHRRTPFTCKAPGFLIQAAWRGARFPTSNAEAAVVRLHFVFCWLPCLFVSFCIIMATSSLHWNVNSVDLSSSQLNQQQWILWKTNLHTACCPCYTPRNPTWKWIMNWTVLSKQFLFVRRYCSHLPALTNLIIFQWPKTTDHKRQKKLEVQQLYFLL